MSNQDLYARRSGRRWWKPLAAVVSLVAAIALVAFLLQENITKAHDRDHPDATASTATATAKTPGKSTGETPFQPQRVKAMHRASRAAAVAICTTGHAAPTVCGKIRPGKRNLLIFGDSIGYESLNIVQQMDPDANVLISTVAGCPPFTDLSGFTYETTNCPAINARRLPDIARLAPRVDAVLLAAGATPDRLHGLVGTVKWLQSLGAHVSVMGLGSVYHDDASQILQDNGSDGAPAILWQQLMVTSADNATARSAVTATGATYLDRFDLICHAAACKATVGGLQVTIDIVHMTYEGALWVGKRLIDQRDKLWP
jgi:hypothetical protein